MRDVSPIQIVTGDPKMRCRSASTGCAAGFSIATLSRPFWTDSGSTRSRARYFRLALASSARSTRLASISMNGSPCFSQRASR